MNFRIAIIGAGEIGRAIERVLHEKKIVPSLWDKDSSKVINQKSLSETVSSADIVLACVPSWCAREAINALSRHIRPETAIISLAKGIEAKTNMLIPKLLEKLLPQNPCGILGGPMIAEEIISGKGGIGVIAGNQKEVSRKIAALFANTSLQILSSDDLVGVALAGALKNIYTLSSGIAEGLGWGINRMGRLISDALCEMQEIVKLFGGKEETVWGPAGAGDLVATCFSPHSRNKEVGAMLAKTGRLSMQSEGTTSLAPMIELVGERKHNFPLLRALERACVNGENTEKIFTEYFSR